MSDINVAEIITKVANNFPAEHRRSAIAAVFGIAVSTLIGVPSSPLEGVNRTTYLNENTEVVRALLWRFNETVPFSIDRTMQVAYVIWNGRYDYVHECTSLKLLTGAAPSGLIREVVQDFDVGLIKPEYIDMFKQLIKAFSA